VLAADRCFSDDRVMRRMDGEASPTHPRGLTGVPVVFGEMPTRRSGVQARDALTPRECDIAALLIEGMTGKEVALALGISP